jgi:hypothetical protein
MPTIGARSHVQQGGFQVCDHVAGDVNELVPSSLPPAGPMAPHLGARLTVEQLNQYGFCGERDQYEEISDIQLANVRAYEVPALVGLELEWGPGQTLWDCVQRTLQDLTGCSWSYAGEAYRDGPVRKYRLLHTRLVGPRDEATGQPMELEMSGDVGLDAPVVKIRTATWANKSFLGYRVPFYA